MDLIQCPHCKTRVFPSRDGECPSCRKFVNAPENTVGKGEIPWAAELPEPESGLVTVARFDDPVEASLAKNCLEEAGFEVFLADAETVSVAWQLSNALGGIKLQVAELKAAQARTILQEQHDASAGDQKELVQEAITATCVAGEESEDLLLEDDESDEPEPDLTGREKDAERAFRGAVFGLLFFPLQFYASFLLLKVLFSSEALSGRSRGRAFVAATITADHVWVAHNPACRNQPRMSCAVTSRKPSPMASYRCSLALAPTRRRNPLNFENISSIGV